MANGDGLEGLLGLPDWVKILFSLPDPPPPDTVEIMRLVSIFVAAATLREEGVRASLLQNTGRALVAEISAKIGDPVPMPWSAAGE